MSSTLLPKEPQTPGYQLATFAAGCFWGVEKFFVKEFKDAISLQSTRVGYTGGHQAHPTYEQVCSGSTGHAEAFRFEYNPQKVSYRQLLEYFFRLHDPTTLNRQGNDVGTQYRSAIFYHSPEQKQEAEKVRKEIKEQYYPTQQIVTDIVEAGEFWEAEPYHQKYLEKHPAGYCNHRLRW